MMYSSAGVSRLHLEVTSRCNASCPMCARNIQGGVVNPHLPITELSAEDVRMFFPDEVLSQFKEISICGNFGDPAAAQDLLEICSDLKSRKADIRVSVHSNGGARSPQWWRRLSSVVDVCHFGIDGLEDTNHLYRRGVSWEKLMNNVRSYIEGAQGAAIWDFIVFKHNEHQIESAEQMANQLGFVRIQFKKTSRFLRSRDFKVIDRQPVFDAEPSMRANRLRPSYWIERPDWKHVNAGLRQIQETKLNPEGLETFLNTTPIRCKAKAEQSVYVSAEGLVLPCCWLAGRLYSWFPNSESFEVEELLKSLPEGRASLSLRSKTLPEILSSSIFTQTIPQSWLAASSEDGRLRTCARTCGIDFETFSTQIETASKSFELSCS